jgi:hypothetical protein
MKCLTTEQLVGYAYGMAEKRAEAEVRAHLGECSRCRDIVEQYSRLNSVLDEWKTAPPTPWFDARLREAVEAQEARGARGFWERDWLGALALAALGLLIITGVVWFTRTHASVSNTSTMARRAVTQAPRKASAPANVAELHAPGDTAPAGVTSAPALPDFDLAGVSVNDDKDTQALEDYDLAANFDVLSELPKEQPRVAN